MCVCVWYYQVLFDRSQWEHASTMLMSLCRPVISLPDLIREFYKGEPSLLFVSLTLFVGCGWILCLSVGQRSLYQLLTHTRIYWVLQSGFTHQLLVNLAIVSSQWADNLNSSEGQGDGEASHEYKIHLDEMIINILSDHHFVDEYQSEVCQPRMLHLIVQDLSWILSGLCLIWRRRVQRWF